MAADSSPPEQPVSLRDERQGICDGCGWECEQKGETVTDNDRYGEWEDERVDGEGG